MKEIKNILIAGVGGQGTLLASKLLGNCFVEQGYDVKVSEVHGMSQRGGSVVTYVRYGEKVYSPVIDIGQADIVIAFEQLEAARWLPYIKQDGVLITNTQVIYPMPVISGAMEYPADIIEAIKAKGINVIAADALAIAEEAGSVRAVNVVLLGMAAKFLGLEKSVWHEVIKSTVPPKTTELNIKAFDLGYEAA